MSQLQEQNSSGEKSVELFPEMLWEIDIAHLNSNLHQSFVSSNIFSKVSHFLCDPYQWNSLEKAHDLQIDFSIEAAQNFKQQSNNRFLIVVLCHAEWLGDPFFKSADGFYIPGQHCRQGDLLTAASATLKPLWIERGSFLSPTDFRNVIDRTPGASKVTLVDAGSHFGYADRVLDARALMLCEQWNCHSSLSYTDLVAGDSSDSGYRPKWENDTKLFDFVFRMSALWQTGLVFKKHPRTRFQFLHDQIYDISESLKLNSKLRACLQNFATIETSRNGEAK